MPSARAAQQPLCGTVIETDGQLAVEFKAGSGAKADPRLLEALVPSHKLLPAQAQAQPTQAPRHWDHAVPWQHVPMALKLLTRARGKPFEHSG